MALIETIGTFTIASGSKVSNTLSQQQYGRYNTLGIYAPVSGNIVTATLQVAAQSTSSMVITSPFLSSSFAAASSASPPGSASLSDVTVLFTQLPHVNPLGETTSYIPSGSGWTIYYPAYTRLSGSVGVTFVVSGSGTQTVRQIEYPSLAWYPALNSSNVVITVPTSSAITLLQTFPYGMMRLSGSVATSSSISYLVVGQMAGVLTGQAVYMT